MVHLTHMLSFGIAGRYTAKVVAADVVAVVS